VAQSGPVTRVVRADFPLGASRLGAFMGLEPVGLVPDAASALRLTRDPGTFVKVDDRFERLADGDAAPRMRQLTGELRAGMKRWGYIHDEAKY
jgi:hypothetical protein